MNKQNLADNLRLLSKYKKSISEVCRDIGINRQQFNKYLSAKTAPSVNNLLKICEYFGVEEHELFMPYEDFEQIIKLRPTIDNSAVRGHRPEIDFLDKLIQHSSENLSKYEGGYFIYYRSSSFPDMILRGYGVIYEDDGKHFFKWIERLSLKEGSSYGGFVWKIKGLVLSLGGRIFVSGYEQLQMNEMVHLTLFPTYKNKVSVLSGLMLDISGSDTREPICVRVMLSYLGKEFDHRKALKLCGTFDADSDDIRENIKAGIINNIEPGESTFKGRPV